jgi:hypothetical protein
VNTGTKTIAVLLTASLMLVVGCGAPEAKTPKDAAMNFVKSIHNSDKALFLASVDIEDTELAEAMFDTMAPMIDFAKAFEAEYGKDKMEGMSMDDIPTVDDVEKMEIKEDGDKATGTLAGKDDPIQLIKKDGVWKVDMSKDMPSAKERDQVLKMAKGMGDAVEKAKERIGKDSAEDVMKAFGAAMMAVMMGAAG